ncbi:MAG: 16S rRNA (cytosine(1402)-N(4))-methyltransferase RsmH [Alicyclobacillaceae bacterium]|nr:16S rRNA (cytosine(1402)-N(4))-methyltransferase RsmH [Alicyclobacillaceae bacterium]
MLETFEHSTVLLTEAVDAVRPRDGGRYIDCTLGGGGHTRLLLERSAPSGRVLALDQDLAAIRHAGVALAAYRSRLTVVHANFRQIRDVARETGFAPADGVLFDLGVSSPQFDEAQRGFSYRWDAPLDMRMDVTRGKTAAWWVNEADESELARIFFEYGEERFARRIARAIVKHRVRAPVETTGELADIVKQAIPAAARRGGGHPARRVFQALRIAVNDELNALAEALPGAFDILAPGGRMAVITFHSLEDRMVKRAFVDWSRGCVCPPEFPVCRCGRKPGARILTRRPITPSEQEILRNHRARSAKLRVLEKLDSQPGCPPPGEETT